MPTEEQRQRRRERLRRSSAVYLGDHRALTRLSTNHKMYVDTRDTGIAPHLLLDGYWEQWITDAIRPYMPGALMFDVGANFGWYSVQAFAASARKVISFEPNEDIMALLRMTMQVNGMQFDLHQEAVGDSNHDVKLQTSSAWAGSGTCMEGGGGFQAESVRTVPQVTLDQVAAQVYRDDSTLESAQVLLKVDVEGFEPRAVLGATELLRRNCTAFVEHHADPAGTNKLKEMLDLFEQRGYSMGHVKHDGSVRQIGRDDLSKVRDADMLCFAAKR